MKLLLLLFFSSIVAFANDIKPQTDLGERGNAYVKDRFTTYLNAPTICGDPDTSAVRVLLSGFGPFRGSAENGSGSILREFGSFAQPVGNADQYGATRMFNINGVNYQICFVVASTMWDLAAAVLMWETEVFQPHFLLMTGLGSTNLLFETGNSNRALFTGGFDIDGNPVNDSTPKENYVLPTADNPARTRLTWDASAAMMAVYEDVEALGFMSAIPQPGYAANNYICNNIGYVESVAATGGLIQLAGGMITMMKNGLHRSPKIGFMHYPSSVRTDQVSLRAWTEILKKIIVSQKIRP